MVTVVSLIGYLPFLQCFVSYDKRLRIIESADRGIVFYIFCPGMPLPFPYKLMGAKLHSLTAKEAHMQNSQDILRKSSTALLDAIGGEPLAGSGFETEDPDEGFSVTDEAVEE
jgi:hypothetical protein